MDETRLIQCPCGQESQLVLLKGRWHYDETRHGNGEPCEGLCFNCRALLKDDEISEESPEPVDEPAEETEPGDVPKVSTSMKKDELVEMAEDMGIEVPAGATKADIIELILQGPEPEG